MSTRAQPRAHGAVRMFLARLRRPAGASALTFVVVLTLALVVAAFVAAQWQTTAGHRFARRAAALRDTVEQALVADEAALRGARGWLAQQPAPSSAAWRQYAADTVLDDSRLAVVALGYFPLPLGVSETASAQSAQSTLATLWAGPAASEAGSAFDTGAAAVAARRYALQTGNAGLAAEAAPEPAQPRLLLYLPVYAAPAAGDAQRPLAGFTVALLDVQRLFEPIVASRPDLALAVHAGQHAAELYRSAPTENAAVAGGARFEHTDTIVFGGTTLTLHTSADGSPFVTGAALSAAPVLLFGVLAAALSAFLAHRLARANAASPGRLPASEPAVSDARLNEARLNEARMMGIVRSSMEAIITVDEAQRIVIFNPAAEFVFGLSAMEAIGSPLSRFIPERFRPAHARHVDQFGATGVTERQMGHQQRTLFGLRANGEEFPIEASISQIHDVSGKLFTVMLRDITERLRAEDSLKRSREELRELSANLQNVREAEKTRIARELHDDLGQQLTALKIDLSTLQNRLGGAVDDDIATRLDGMGKLIDSTVRAVRRIAADLRPVMLDDLGLVPAIEWLANDFTSRYGIAVQQTIHTGNTVFSGEAASALFRIIQEALTNVARHAEASVVTLKLEVDSQHCTLRIADNGRGAQHTACDPQRHGRREKSFGLLGIRERAHMFNGEVEIDTAPGEGFAIAITFALDALLPAETAS
ncbi:PAS domain-containing sensor histidine kinase [Paraburkholderia tropica]|uniref:Multi-sensor signal transduction histidine kinase n=1 Tax=Paraburkholderia tropica TaxID=92647 RepID=A0AAQ1JY73_9BURK|nr:PAS domain-containing sensor histidine kinase [Paraburkholderia tropica]MBB2981161.1 PAS domain S-box-containing protein [Paraburkholderia tropica]SEK14558.1 multi-sensor signal transduction histidine kinase [Paraburkholderia tropica]